MSEQETYESISFQQLHKVLQEAYTKLTSALETASVSQEEFDLCINTLSKRCSLRSPTPSAYGQAPRDFPKD